MPGCLLDRVVFRGGIAYFFKETVIPRHSSTVSLRGKKGNIRKVLREDDMDPLIHTLSGQPLKNSSRMEPTPPVLSSFAHWVT